VDMVAQAHEIPYAPDGIRYSRWAIIRDTYPNLKGSTIKTFCEWFPPGMFGTLKMDVPITYEFFADGVYSEFVFLALDRPDDIGKLLSAEFTGAFLNEGSTIAKTHIDHIDGRLTFPPRDFGGEHARHTISVDFNPPDDDHWIAELERKVIELNRAKEDGENSAGWDGVVEGYADSTSNAMDALYEADEVEIDPADYDFFWQPSGLSDQAENLRNLPGGQDYYKRLARGKPSEFVRVYVHGKYGSSQDGKPVYPEFHRFITINGVRVPWHVSPEPLKPLPGIPIFVSFDFGLPPTCVIMQYTPQGQLRVLREILAGKMGLTEFIKSKVRFVLNTEFRGLKQIVTGDPAGKDPAITDQGTCLQILRAEGWMDAELAETNVFQTRREAVAEYLNGTSGEGQPAFICDPGVRNVI